MYIYWNTEAKVKLTKQVGISFNDTLRCREVIIGDAVKVTTETLDKVALSVRESHIGTSASVPYDFSSIRQFYLHDKKEM